MSIVMPSLRLMNQLQCVTTKSLYIVKRCSVKKDSGSQLQQQTLAMELNQRYESTMTYLEENISRTNRDIIAVRLPLASKIFALDIVS